MNHYKRFWPLKILFFLIAAVALLSVVGFFVMTLWNRILPDITGVSVISFWQALGILILSRILFGGWGRFGGRHFAHKRARWQNKWQEMNNEERTAFKARWKERCGRKDTT
ncbi:MAG: hypothetical protein IPL46_13595 [Saprospiraceae bacterium]|nr:hypothetical protein [Saprospiraceae bacterium]